MVGCCVGCCVFAVSMKSVKDSRDPNQMKKISSMNLLQKASWLVILCVSWVSILAMKMFAYGTAIFVPIAVPCICK